MKQPVEAWVMATFKDKYSHKIFDIQAIRGLCDALFEMACYFYKINCKKRSFASDHVYMILDTGII